MGNIDIDIIELLSDRELNSVIEGIEDRYDID